MKIHVVTLSLEKTNRENPHILWLSVLYVINISSRTTKTNIKTSLPSTMKNTSGPIEKIGLVRHHLSSQVSRVITRASSEGLRWPHIRLLS